MDEQFVNEESKFDPDYEYRQGLRRLRIPVAIKVAGIYWFVIGLIMIVMTLFSVLKLAVSDTSNNAFLIGTCCGLITSEFIGYFFAFFGWRALKGTLTNIYVGAAGSILYAAWLFINLVILIFMLPHDKEQSIQFGLIQLGLFLIAGALLLMGVLAIQCRIRYDARKEKLKHKIREQMRKLPPEQSISDDPIAFR